MAVFEMSGVVFVVIVTGGKNGDAIYGSRRVIDVCDVHACG
jgi:hypothetical protein